MEAQERARRRVRRIMDHAAAVSDRLLPPSPPELFPMNCSATLSTNIRRCDSRLLFARQGSVSQGQFMQPASGFEDSSNSLNDSPKFARLDSGVCEKQQLTCSKDKQASINKGQEWSPRFNVAESAENYFVTVELPGVHTNDILVEVNDQSLTVMGKRSMHLLKVRNGCESFNPTYHRREILQGPYRVIWPIPSNVNKETVSAELVDGFLQITLPKL